MMKIVHRGKQAHPDASQKMLRATPTVDKAILMAGFVLVFALVIFVVEIRWILEGKSFGTNQWVFTAVMIALFVGTVLLGRRIPRSIKLERNGELIEGRIVGGWRETDDDSENFFLAFTTSNLTFKQQVNRTRYQAYEPGDQISVIQLPEQPEIARILFP